MIVLLQCPFCGSDNSIVVQETAQIPDRAKLGHSRFFVSCLGCGARGPWGENADAGGAVVQVIEKWNERTQERTVVQ